MAQMKESPENFIKKVFTISFMGSFSLSFLFIGPILFTFGKGFVVSFVSFPVLFLMLYSYFLKMPDYYILKLGKNITKELIFALRFLIIELQSGIMIDKSFNNVRRNYPAMGYYFGKVMDKVDYGESFEEALNWAVRIAPSENLRLVFVQIQNSMKSGADIVDALNVTVDQFTREQQIMVSDYSKKLNPIAMFYMIVAVIFPSIGFMMLVIISSFVGFELDLTVLLFIVGFVGFMQFMFVSVVKSIRPPVEM